MQILPNIDYKYWLKDWEITIGCKNIYSNRNLEKYINFNGNINSCTNEIKKLTSQKKPSREQILRVIDLIYSWGGPSGRMFYSKNNNGDIPRDTIEKDKDVFLTYLTGIDEAKKSNLSSRDTFTKIVGIGPSYASKHSYFWSINSKYPLIIVDSKISGSLGFTTIHALYQNISYQDIISVFINKSKEIFRKANASLIERALFAFHNNYFLNNNKKWRNNSFNSKKNYDEAKRLSKLLFNLKASNVKD